MRKKRRIRFPAGCHSNQNSQQICPFISIFMDAAEYKHVVLGLIFLRYISGAFEELRVISTNNLETIV